MAAGGGGAPLQAALEFVLPPAPHTPRPASAGLTDDERLAAANFRLFDLNAEARDALARQQRAGAGGRGARGRAGPPQVTVDLGSATPFLTISGPADGTSLAPLSLESAQGFSSCRANTAVVSGRWQYEVVLRSHGILQLGWCLKDTPFTINNGVGDAPDSYAYDGKRMKRWNVRARTYGRPWAAGDVIGCCIDLSAGEQPPEQQQQQQQQAGESAGAGSGAVAAGTQQPAAAAPQPSQPPTGTITFYRNGTSLGTAFANVRMLQHGAAYFPGLSLSQGERCDVNFGATPFLYPVGGYAPLQAPPPPAAEGYMRTVTCALARLLLLRLRRCAGRGGAGCGGWGGAPSAAVSAEEADAVEGRLAALLSDARAAEAAAAAEAHSHANGGTAAEQAAAGAGAAVAAAGASAEAAPAWPGDAAFALLAGLVGDHVAWLLQHSEWWLHAYLLPLVLRVHGLEPPHAGGALRALMQLCQLALPADGFSLLVSALGRVLGHYASMAPFQRPPEAAAGAPEAAPEATGSSSGAAPQAAADGKPAAAGAAAAAAAAAALPAACRAWGSRPAPGIFESTGFSGIRQLAFTGAYPFTAALAAAVELPDAASAWAHGPQWLLQMEAVLTRKLPTLDDLKELMPHVPKFAAGDAASGGAGGGRGGPRVKMQGGEAFRADVRQLTSAMRGIEANQMALAAAAADAAPLRGPGSGGGGRGAAAAAAAPPMLQLVRHVLRRNRFITSSSPPPGLSDGTVLTSLFYLLLRMLQPYVSGARPSHSLRHFPAGRLFVHSAAAEPPPPPPALAAPAGGVGPLTAGRRGGGSRSAPAPDDGVGEVLSDLVRVGGLLSHLTREAPVRDDVLARHGGHIDVPEWAGAPRRAPRSGAGGASGASAFSSLASGGSLASGSLDGAAAGNAADGADGAAVPPPLADEWLPELLAAALVLYTWRVSGSVQSGTAMAGVMEANIGGMQELSELERMLEAAGGAGAQGGAGPMAAARSTVQSEVESSTRYVAITQVVLFSGWKAGALLSLSAYVMAMLAALAALGGSGPAGPAPAPTPQQQQQQQQQQSEPAAADGAAAAARPSTPPASSSGPEAEQQQQLARLLMYVPCAFIAAPLELLLALQASGSPFAAASCKLTEPQLNAYVGFVVACLCDDRVVHPDVRELIMRALSTLLESPGCIAAMERHPAAINSLVPRLMGSFSGEHWQEVALALLRLVGGAGLGELVEAPGSSSAATAAAAAAAAAAEQQQQQVGSPTGSDAPPPPRRHAADWRARLVPAQRVDSAGAALTVVEAVAAHVGRGGQIDSLDSIDGGSPGGGGSGAGPSGPSGRPSSGSDLFRASFGAYASSNLEAAARFLGQLYDSLNSVLTESASLVVELHRAVGLAPARAAPLAAGVAGEAGADAGEQPAEGEQQQQQQQEADGEGAQQEEEQQPGGAQQPPGGAQQQQQQGPPQPPPERLSQSQLQQRYRRAAALVDVSIALLRLLEATARDVPAVFLCGATAPLAMARLIELLSFVMRHYCSGAEARRLGQLLRQRSLAIARTRRGGDAAGAAGAAAARAAFPMPGGVGGGTLNFNVPVPGIGNLTFMVHAPIDDAANEEAAAQAGGDAAAAAAAAGAGPQAEEHSPVERLARAAVLAPLAGVILNLALAEQLPDEAPEGGNGNGGGPGGGVRSTAALVGTKQLRARADGRSPTLCPACAPRRRSFVEQLAASDIPMTALRQLLSLDWLQLEASRRLLRPERTAGAVAGLLLQDGADLRSGAEALREERRRSHAASPTPMDVDAAGEERAAAGGSEDGEGEEDSLARAWAAANDSGDGGSGGGGGEAALGHALRQQLEQLRAVLDAVSSRRAAAAGALGGAGAGRLGSAGGGPAVEVPDEFLDPLTAAVMEDPVILPASRMVVDRSTIARHLTYQATDPFSRSPLTLEEVVADEQLAARIREWQLQHGG